MSAWATAICAACASSIVFSFLSFSSLRSLVASAMASSSFATAFVISEISSVSLETEASSWSISACKVSTASLAPRGTNTRGQPRD